MQFGVVAADTALLPLALAQALVAASLAAAMRAPRWWLAIHLAFAPLLALATQLHLAPGWYLAGFVLLALIYGAGAGAQIPLYLSNRPTAQAVARLLPTQPGSRVIDLGAGSGSFLAALAAAHPELKFVGIEAAPLPYLVGRLLTAGRANLDWRRGNFWRENLATYDVAYAFLSPVPMPRLWQKACGEMRPGALLICNSFAIAQVQPEAVIEVGDRRHTRLYLYRLAGPASAKSA